MNRRTSASRFLKWAAALALAAASAGTALGLEISLEENKASRGNIGYVDIHKVFRLFPETAKAKQSYQEIVRQAEEQVNLRKAELITLRSDLSKLKLEKDLLEKTPIPVPPPPIPPAQPLQEPTTPQSSVVPPAASTGALVSVAGSSAPAILISLPEKADLVLTKSEPLTPGLSQPASLSQLPGMSPVVSSGAAASPAAPEKGLPPLPGTAALVATTAPAAPAASAAPAPVEKPVPAPALPDKKIEPLVINIPGVTEKPIVVEAPGDALLASPKADAQAAAVSSGAPTAVAATPTAAPETKPATPATPVEDPLKIRSAKLAELDAKIATKQSELDDKEKSFLAHQAQLEKDLIDIENRRAELLLGKIYDAIREVARESGVSVVVDKSQILFGQNSVDLTDKVVKKLQELAS